jgi:hypothetical protein
MTQTKDSETSVDIPDKLRKVTGTVSHVKRPTDD